MRRALRFAPAALWFALLVSLPLAAEASTIYVVDTTGVYTFNSVSGVSTKITTFPNGTYSEISASAQRASDGMIYFINDNGAGDGQVYAYNPATPATQPVKVGTGTGSGIPYFPRLGFDINGTLWATPLNDADIYSISTTTGAVVTTSALTGVSPPQGGDMAFGPDGVCYEVAENIMYVLPTGGGAIKTIGTISGISEDLSGLAFDSTGNLFALGTEASPPTSIYKITNYATAPAGTLFVTTPAAQSDFASEPVLLADLTIAKTASTGSSVGGLILYGVTVSNAGPAAAAGTKISDPLPTGATVNGTPTCSGTGGAVCGAVTVASNVVKSTITTLPAGGTVTFSIDATATVLGTLTNTATLTPPALLTNTGNSSASASTVVSAANGVQKTVANLTQSGSAGSSDNAKPGDVLQYVLTYTNQTGATLSSFQFADVVPTNTTYVTASASCPTIPATLTCSPALVSGKLTFFASGGSLANGATVSVKFNATVN
jgi:uncharacterized repeat protein (TIGR01451 family)